MKKEHFYIFKLQQLILPLILISFTICLVIFSNTNLSAAKNGLILWSNSIVPSLFPFFVATELLSHTNFTYYLGKVLNRFMKPIFNIRGEGSFAFIMGIISGYPIGAKIAANFRQNKICSKEECERLLSFTNNSGPLFIIGSVGILMYRNTSIGILLFITHFIASLSVGFIFRFWKSNSNQANITANSHYWHNQKIPNPSDLGEILSESIISSIKSILLIGGFVVIFSSIIAILHSSGIIPFLNLILNPISNILNIDSKFIDGFLTGCLEITNGINIIANIPFKKLSINIIITSFLLGFGGISILLQVFSIISKSDLSIKPYIYGKLLHGILSAFYTYLFINIFPFFNFDL